MTERDRLVNFIKSVSTAGECHDFLTEEDLKKLPLGVANRIAELEGLISRLGCEAEALLWRMGIGHELYGKRGK